MDGGLGPNPRLAPETVDLTTVMASQSELAFLLDINWGVMLTCGALYFVLGYALYSAFLPRRRHGGQESDAQYYAAGDGAPAIQLHVGVDEPRRAPWPL